MNRLNLQFRYQPLEHSRYAPLIHYLNQGKGDLEIPRRELVMNALEAFWLPFGVQWGGGSPEEVEKAVKRSVYLLEHQIEFLRDRLGSSRTKARQAASAPQTKEPSPPSQLPPQPSEDPEENDEEVFLDDDQDYSDEDFLLDSTF